MFKESEKSTFKYFFAHWCAYQMTALNLKVWKFRFLFHDVEKPWLKLILRNYEKVRHIHRKYNKHHLAYRNPNKIDWLGLVIDWECSRFTKEDAPLNARQTYEYEINKRKGPLTELIKEKVPPILDKLGL